jgi:hypothetical protein
LHIGHVGYQTGIEFSAEFKFKRIFWITASGIVLLLCNWEYFFLFISYRIILNDRSF